MDMMKVMTKIITMTFWKGFEGIEKYEEKI